jgi:NitT/TauT family transport system substrate-binding protein
MKKRHFQGVSTALYVFWVFFILAGAVFSLPQKAFSKDEPIRYRLKWLFNASVVGDLYAMDNGFFKTNGLNVEVKPGGPERDAIKELELGQAEFGVASADQVIRAMAKGSPVIVLAQFFQINPLQWMYRADAPPIDKIEDLKGRILGVTFGGNDETVLRTLLAMGHLTEKEVTLFSVRYDYTPFFQKKVDIWPIYRNSQAVFLGRKLKAEGDPIRFFDPNAFGVKFVANSLVTSRRMVEAQPELAMAFKAALLKAWEASLDPANEEAALTLLKKYDKDTDPEDLKEQLRITREMVKPSPGVAIGGIDVPAWEQTEQIMLDQKQIDHPVQVTKALVDTPK